MRANQQQTLPFDDKREQARLETIERLWGDHPQVKTAAKMFDYDEATRIAHSASPSLDACIEVEKHQDALGGLSGNQ